MKKMLSKEIKIQNVRGLHARATANFVKLADTFKSEIFVTNKDGLRVSGKSIMGLLMLGAPLGSDLTLEATGNDAEKALNALTELVDNKFGEAV
ncbi:MAG: HPr family phosphocarrier protein [Alphaproteobacteria bacterium]